MRYPFSSVRRASGAVLVMAALMIAPPAPSSAQTDLTVGHVPFLTLRNLTGDADPDTMFGDERSGLSAGVCGVRELDLQGLAPLADAAPSFLREEFLRVETVEPAAPMAIYDALQDGEAEAPAIYVHGYYISFEKGCRRAALFQDNANIAGRFLWFSWPFYVLCACKPGRRAIRDAPR
jgi:hypothetical protein